MKILTLFLLCGLMSAADDMDQYTAVITRSLDALTHKKYDEYLACYEPGCANIEVVKANIKKLKDLDDVIIANENGMTNFKKLGEDEHFFYMNAVHANVGTFLVKGETTVVRQKYYVLLVFSKATHLVTGYVPLQDLSQDSDRAK